MSDNLVHETPKSATYMKVLPALFFFYSYFAIFNMQPVKIPLHVSHFFSLTMLIAFISRSSLFIYSGHFFSSFIKFHFLAMKIAIAQQKFQRNWQINARVMIVVLWIWKLSHCLIQTQKISFMSFGMEFISIKLIH